MGLVIGDKLRIGLGLWMFLMEERVHKLIDLMKKILASTSIIPFMLNLSCKKMIFLDHESFRDMYSEG